MRFQQIQSEITVVMGIISQHLAIRLDPIPEMPAELKQVAILDMNGTRDEAIPPRTVDAHREAMEPYARKYRVARFEDMPHYLFTQDHIKIVGSVWLRFIDSGYFD